MFYALWHMKKYLGFAAVLSLALLGQGCISINAPQPAPTPAPVPAPVGRDTETLAAVCPVTPQIYFFNKLAFSEAEIASIRANVIAPLVTYYHETDQAEVVSIMIKRTDTGIIVDAIVDEFETEDAIYHGFVHPRTGSSYPRWYPEEVPPEYRG